MRRLALIEEQRRRLYAEPPPSPGMARLAALERIVAAQGARLAALEARLRERAPDPLLEHNANAQAAGERLREAIAGILATHHGPGEMTRKHVLRDLERMDLGREKLPSLSAIGWHMREIRRAQAVNGNTAALTPE